MAIVTTPVTEPSQLQSIFGYTGITDYSKIFTDLPINMWARFKPVRSSTLHKLVDDNGNPTDELKILNFGLTITTFDSNSVENILSAAMADNTGWSYGKPRGSAYNEWFRGWDWVGYNHAAECPFYFEAYSSGGSLKVRVGQRAGLPTNSLQVTDIGGVIGLDNPTGSGYGFIYKRGSNAAVHEWFDTSGTSVKYPLTEDHEVTLTSVAGTYQVCAYIGDLNHTGTVVLVPIKGQTVTVSAPLPDVTITAYFNDLSLANPTFYFTIKCNASGGISAGTAELKLKNSSGKEFESFQFSIPALSYNGTYSYDEKFELSETVASWSFTYKGVTING